MRCTFISSTVFSCIVSIHQRDLCMNIHTSALRRLGGCGWGEGGWLTFLSGQARRRRLSADRCCIFKSYVLLFNIPKTQTGSRPNLHHQRFYPATISSLMHIWKACLVFSPCPNGTPSHHLAAPFTLFFAPVKASIALGRSRFSSKWHAPLKIISWSNGGRSIKMDHPLTSPFHITVVMRGCVSTCFLSQPRIRFQLSAEALAATRLLIGEGCLGGISHLIELIMQRMSLRLSVMLHLRKMASCPLPVTGRSR